MAPLGLTVAASTIDAAIQKKILWSGARLIISNEEMDYIIKIVKSLEELGVLIKGVSEVIKKKAKDQRMHFFGMLLGALTAIISQWISR